MTSVRENWECVRASIESACRRVQRAPEEITVVAVTKSVPVERILQARECGIQIYGENRIQEAASKIPQIQQTLEWHMIGHLQGNKAAMAIEMFSLIQSVDTIKLAERLNQVSLAGRRRTRILLEVNISGEVQKYGFKPDGVKAALDRIAALEAIQVEGLMGIAPFTAQDAPRRSAFRDLKALFTACASPERPNVRMKHLSMGMSGDFELAIEEGSNMIRLGRALFA